MRRLLALLIVLILAGTSLAYELGNRPPTKPADHSVYSPPDEVRQGGDYILNAVPIDAPSTWTGTTTGYSNDYDEVCPFSGSTAPDVVYSYLPTIDQTIWIDLCYSSYDTKVYVYDQDLNLVGCNDDYYYGPPCHPYSSKLDVDMQAGTTYYIVIDGYGSSSGAYEMDFGIYCPGCHIDCPPDAQLEDEPPLQDGYVDVHNSGCGGGGSELPFQTITEPIFCGKSGWYLSAEGAEFRDTDWFHITIPEGGVLEITGDAELQSYMFELGPQDCAEVGVLQIATIGPCHEQTMTIIGDPGSLVWFWVGPTTFSGPVQEYVYVLYLNLEGPVTTQRATWTGVRSLFR
jgi:hypothetical protein